MKYGWKWILPFLAAVLIVVAGTTAAKASTASWVPGTAYWADESEAGDLLERTYDSAYCDGVARFGKHGSFPYEEFRVMDCDIYTYQRGKNISCTFRYKVVKGSHYGYFRLKLWRVLDGCW